MTRRPPGFTTLELLLVLGFFGLMAAMVAVPLSTLQSSSALRDGAVGVRNALRRAVTQAMSGLDGDRWGVHFSDSDGCALPASKYHIFRGNAFSSTTDTIETFEVPAGASITAVSLGGGCDAKFSRFHGTATTTGTVTLTDLAGATRTVIVNGYGRISTQ